MIAITLSDETVALIRIALQSQLTTLNTLAMKGSRSYRVDVGARASATARALDEIEASVSAYRAKGGKDGSR